VCLRNATARASSSSLSTVERGTFWPHRSIIEEGALAPLHHRFRIKIVAAGELLDRSLRSLYSSSDGVRGLGAARRTSVTRTSSTQSATCAVPECRGISHADATFREALWDRFFTAATAYPAPRSPDGSRRRAVACAGEP